MPTQRWRFPPKPGTLRGASLRRAEAALDPPLVLSAGGGGSRHRGRGHAVAHLTDSGQLAGVEIARGSGHALLDQAALDAARRIGSLPGTKRQMLFPVSFRLQ
jgi:TonB family protein